MNQRYIVNNKNKNMNNKKKKNKKRLGFPMVVRSKCLFNLMCMMRYT